MNGRCASADAAQCPAKQRMGRGQRQRPARRVPSGLDEKSRIQQHGQACGVAAQRDPDQHMVETADRL
jgi:hypothetical protein